MEKYVKHKDGIEYNRRPTEDFNPVEFLNKFNQLIYNKEHELETNEERIDREHLEEALKKIEELPKFDKFGHLLSNITDGHGKIRNPFLAPDPAAFRTAKTRQQILAEAVKSAKLEIKKQDISYKRSHVFNKHFATRLYNSIVSGSENVNEESEWDKFNIQGTANKQKYLKRLTRSDVLQAYRMECFLQYKLLEPYVGEFPQLLDIRRDLREAFEATSVPGFEVDTGENSENKENIAPVPLRNLGYTNIDDYRPTRREFRILKEVYNQPEMKGSPYGPWKDKIIEHASNLPELYGSLRSAYPAVNELFPKRKGQKRLPTDFHYTPRESKKPSWEGPEGFIIGSGNEQQLRDAIYGANRYRDYLRAIDIIGRRPHGETARLLERAFENKYGISLEGYRYSGYNLQHIKGFEEAGGQKQFLRGEDYVFYNPETDKFEFRPRTEENGYVKADKMGDKEFYETFQQLSFNTKSDRDIERKARQYNDYKTLTKDEFFQRYNQTTDNYKDSGDWKEGFNAYAIFRYKRDKNKPNKSIYDESSKRAIDFNHIEYLRKKQGVNHPSYIKARADFKKNHGIEPDLYEGDKRLRQFDLLNLQSRGDNYRRSREEMRKGKSEETISEEKAKTFNLKMDVTSRTARFSDYLQALIDINKLDGQIEILRANRKIGDIKGQDKVKYDLLTTQREDIRKNFETKHGISMRDYNDNPIHDEDHQVYRTRKTEAEREFRHEAKAARRAETTERLGGPTWMLTDGTPMRPNSRVKPPASVVPEEMKLENKNHLTVSGNEIKLHINGKDFTMYKKLNPGDNISNYYSFAERGGPIISVSEFNRMDDADKNEVKRVLNENDMTKATPSPSPAPPASPSPSPSPAASPSARAAAKAEEQPGFIKRTVDRVKSAFTGTPTATPTKPATATKSPSPSPTRTTRATTSTPATNKTAVTNPPPTMKQRAENILHPRQLLSIRAPKDTVEYKKIPLAIKNKLAEAVNKGDVDEFVVTAYDAGIHTMRKTLTGLVGDGKIDSNKAKNMVDMINHIKTRNYKPQDKKMEDAVEGTKQVTGAPAWTPMEAQEKVNKFNQEYAQPVNKRGQKVGKGLSREDLEEARSHYAQLGNELRSRGYILTSAEMPMVNGYPEIGVSGIKPMVDWEPRFTIVGGKPATLRPATKDEMNLEASDYRTHRSTTTQKVLDEIDDAAASYRARHPEPPPQQRSAEDTSILKNQQAAGSTATPPPLTEEEKVIRRDKERDMDEKSNFNAWATSDQTRWEFVKRHKAKTGRATMSDEEKQGVATSMENLEKYNEFVKNLTPEEKKLFDAYIDRHYTPEEIAEAGATFHMHPATVQHFKDTYLTNYQNYKKMLNAEANNSVRIRLHDFAEKHKNLFPGTNPFEEHAMRERIRMKENARRVQRFEENLSPKKRAIFNSLYRSKDAKGNIIKKAAFSQVLKTLETHPEWRAETAKERLGILKGGELSGPSSEGVIGKIRSFASKLGGVRSQNERVLNEKIKQALNTVGRTGNAEEDLANMNDSEWKAFAQNFLLAHGNREDKDFLKRLRSTFNKQERNDYEQEKYGTTGLSKEQKKGMRTNGTAKEPSNQWFQDHVEHWKGIRNDKATRRNMREEIKSDPELRKVLENLRYRHVDENGMPNYNENLSPLLGDERIRKPTTKQLTDLLTLARDRRREKREESLVPMLSREFIQEAKDNRGIDFTTISDAALNDEYRRSLKDNEFRGRDFGPTNPGSQGFDFHPNGYPLPKDFQHKNLHVDTVIDEHMAEIFAVWDRLPPETQHEYGNPFLQYTQAIRDFKATNKRDPTSEERLDLVNSLLRGVKQISQGHGHGIGSKKDTENLPEHLTGGFTYFDKDFNPVTDRHRQLIHSANPFISPSFMPESNYDPAKIGLAHNITQYGTDREPIRRGTAFFKPGPQMHQQGSQLPSWEPSKGPGVQYGINLAPEGFTPMSANTLEEAHRQKVIDAGSFIANRKGRIRDTGRFGAGIGYGANPVGTGRIISPIEQTPIGWSDDYIPSAVGGTPVKRATGTSFPEMTTTIPAPEPLKERADTLPARGVNKWTSFGGPKATGGTGSGTGTGGTGGGWQGGDSGWRSFIDSLPPTMPGNSWENLTAGSNAWAPYLQQLSAAFPGMSRTHTTENEAGMHNSERSKIINAWLGNFAPEQRRQAYEYIVGKFPHLNLDIPLPFGLPKIRSRFPGIDFVKEHGRRMAKGAAYGIASGLAANPTMRLPVEEEEVGLGASKSAIRGAEAHNRRLDKMGMVDPVVQLLSSGLGGAGGNLMKVAPLAGAGMLAAGVGITPGWMKLKSHMAKRASRKTREQEQTTAGNFSEAHLLSRAALRRNNNVQR
jgi:hypothetical protein